MQIKLFNTLSGREEAFLKEEASVVKIYVCGITPYSASHIGHARSYINFDVLVRMLKFAGYQVKFARNYTDIDDKLLHKESQEGRSFLEIAQEFITNFRQHMQELNCVEPDYEPLATGHIPGMIALIEQLLAKDVAYVCGLDVYFDVSKCPNYGQLSGKKLEDLDPGSRVAVVQGKRNDQDFVLWKGNAENKFWPSPFGFGRPGWHIECSAMIRDYFGSGVDIHGGGHDLIFPHHENEIAQYECAYQEPLAQVWMHNALLNIGSDKMSKSVGNMLTIDQALEQVSPMVLRLYVLMHSYRTPIDFSLDKLSDCAQVYAKLQKILTTQHTVEAAPSREDSDDVKREFLAHLTNNLDTAGFIGKIFKYQNLIQQDEALRSWLEDIASQVLGFTWQDDAQEEVLSDQVLDLLALRNEARLNKDWAKADDLREQLLELGHVVQDKKL